MIFLLLRILIGHKGTKTQSINDENLCLRGRKTPQLGGLSLVFKPFYAILDQRNIKIDQIAEPELCQLKMTE
jgi:hypothetical protein